MMSGGADNGGWWDTCPTSQYVTISPHPNRYTSETRYQGKEEFSLGGNLVAQISHIQ